MKKKLLILLCAVIIVGLIGGYLWHRNTFIQIGTETLRRDVTSYTVSGDQMPETALLLELHALEVLDARNVPLTAAEYDALKEALPNCRILWMIPFQGNTYEEDTETLTVASLTPDDLSILPYFPSLKSVDANGCTDYEQLLSLKAQYPALNVSYNVTIQDQTYQDNTTEISLADADIAQLRAAIPYLPQLAKVTFTGITPDNDEIYQLMCDYPNIEFLWNLSLFGMEMSNTATELILSGITMKDTSEVESFLKYFPKLERVEMCDCGIPSEEMDALSKRWPDVRFVWSVMIGKGKIRTDSVGFIPWKFGYDAENPLYDRHVKELKYCVDMVCLDLGHMKVSDLSFLQYMPKLKYLIVGELPCPDFSPITLCKELIYLEIFNTTFAHQEILLEMTNLQDLNMGSTKVYGTEVLKQMTWLKRLWLAGTGLSFAEYDELVAALPDTQVVMHIPHSTAGGWRDHQNYRDMRDLLGMFYME